MAPTALSYTYTSVDDIQTLISVDGYTGRLDDDATGTLSATESAYLTAKGINWATARVNFYLLAHYEAVDLAASWLVNEWCTIVAGYWLSCRRGNPAPGSLKELYEQAVEDMKLVHSGEHNLADVGLRSAAFPSWSSVRVDTLWNLRKVRTERQLSQKKRGSNEDKDYTVVRDLGSEYYQEPR